MRIYFGVCGIGLGHAGRCVPIASALQKMGHEILFSTYSDAIPYLKREDFSLLEAPSISFAVKPNGEIDFRKTTANPGPFSVFIFLNQLGSEIRFMKAFQPDLVISDSRVSSIIAARLLDIPKITILNQYRVTIPRTRRFLNLARIADGGILTIIGEVWTMGRCVLIPDFPSPYTISSSNLTIPPRNRKKIRLIGPIVPTRPDDLSEKREIRERMGFKDDQPLIFVPISGPAEDKAYFIKLLVQLLNRLPEHYQITVSLGDPTPREPVKNGNITIYSWVTNRFEFLKACDLVISRAGLGTISQSICYGKPLVLVPTPSQTEQTSNAKRAEELGVARFILQEELGYKALLTTIRDMLETKTYIERAEQIKREVLGYDAIKTAVETISNTCEGI